MVAILQLQPAACINAKMMAELANLVKLSLCFIVLFCFILINYIHTILSLNPYPLSSMKRISAPLFIAWSMIALLVVVSGLAAFSFVDDNPMASKDWAYYGHDVSNNKFSDLDFINLNTVHQLKEL